MGIKVLLYSFAVLLLSVLNSSAATRLGLHVTQEELNCWKQRAGIVAPNSLTPNCTVKYKTAADVSTNSPGDWTRILSQAATFGSNPLGEMWIASLGWQDIQQGNGPPSGAGQKAAAGGFVALIDAAQSNYVGQVRQLVLAQLAQPGADFTNSSRWPACIGDSIGGLTNYLTRLAFAYDYARIASPSTFSAADRMQIETWFSNAAYYVAGLGDCSVRQAYPNRNAEFDTSVSIGNIYPTDVTGQFPGSGTDNNSGITHYDCTTNTRGHLVGGWHYIYNNRAIEQVRFGAVGSMLNGTLPHDAQSQRWSKMWFKESFVYATFDDNMVAEYFRWSDAANVPTNGWQYSSHLIGGLSTIADLFARTGDTSLYDFATSGGRTYSQNPAGFNANTIGGPKSLLKVIQRHAGFVNQRATGIPGWTGSDDLRFPGGPHCGADRADYLIQSVDIPHGEARVDDTRHALANLYYQDANVKLAYTRQLSGAPAYPVNPATNGAAYAWGGEWWTYPGILFMFGQMEGIVNPYSLTASAPPTVSITTPTSSTTYRTIVSTVTLSGPATDDVGVTSVTWTCPTCTPTSDTASCSPTCGASTTSTTWTISNISLSTYDNVFTVTANDGDTQTAVDTLTVTYFPNSTRAYRLTK